MNKKVDRLAVTELILTVIRLNGVLVYHGEKITRPVGMTPTKWQVLGAIANEDLTVSQISRRMGVTRQGAQRVSNILKESGHITFVDNIDHARSPKASLTAKGRSALAQIQDIQHDWSSEIARQLNPIDIEQVTQALTDLIAALDATEQDFFSDRK